MTTEHIANDDRILSIAVDRAGRTWCVLEREDGTFKVYYHAADEPQRTFTLWDTADYWSDPPRVLLQRAEDAELRVARLRGVLQALYDDWPGPLTESMREAKQVLRKVRER